MMRAKMQVRSVEKFQHGESLKMAPVSGKFDEQGDSEDNTFARYTPSGELQLSITNPALFDQFKPGDTFYLDFTKVEPTAGS